MGGLGAKSPAVGGKGIWAIFAIFKNNLFLCIFRPKWLFEAITHPLKEFEKAV